MLKASEPFEERQFFGNDSDARFDRERILKHVLPQHFNLASVRRENSRQQRKGGRLASAIWPKERKKSPLLHEEVEPVDSDNIAEAFYQAARDQGVGFRVGERNEPIPRLRGPKKQGPACQPGDVSERRILLGR